MRVIALTRYGRLGASSRLRFYQFVPSLEARGIAVTVAALSSDVYVTRLYGGRRPGPLFIGAEYAARVRRLTHLRSFDLIWLEKELFPGAPALLERLLHRVGTPYVVDYDDATFHKYDRSANPFFRRLLPRKIDVVMRHARLVVAGNEYIAQRARTAGAERVEVLPTVVDLARYPVRPPNAGGDFVVGWMGTPVTQDYLSPVAPALAQVCAGGRGRVLLVGAATVPTALAGVPCELRAWSEEREALDVSELEVGIMPLADTEWERGKCGYKLIQYMAAARPVIASPVGVNRELVEHGVNGFLASTTEDWRAALIRLRDDPALRQRMGLAGRERVAARYALDVVAPRLAALLRSAATRPH